MSFEQSQAAHFHADNGAAIAAELTRLSMQEREDVLHDLHGVASSTPETPESIHTALNALHNELKKQCTFTSDYTDTGTTSTITSTPSKSAYQMALQSDNPSYVLDPAFGLLFLRSEHFNVSAAAQKLSRFLQMKLDLFGPSKLCRSITLDDLGPEGVAALENGHFQLLPLRDRSGRAIFCFPAQLYNSNISVHADVSYRKLESGRLPLSVSHLKVFCCPIGAFGFGTCSSTMSKIAPPAILHGHDGFRRY